MNRTVFSGLIVLHDKELTDGQTKRLERLISSLELTDYHMMSFDTVTYDSETQELLFRMSLY